jgi:hypothetical protein
MAAPTQSAGALTRHKGTRPIVTLPRRLARTRRLPAPILLLAAAMAAEARHIPAVAEAPHTVAVVEAPTAVVVVLTAIAQINKISAI